MLDLWFAVCVLNVKCALWIIVVVVEFGSWFVECGLIFFIVAEIFEVKWYWSISWSLFCQIIFPCVSESCHLAIQIRGHYSVYVQFVTYINFCYCCRCRSVTITLYLYSVLDKLANDEYLSALIAIVMARQPCERLNVWCLICDVDYIAPHYGLWHCCSTDYEIIR